MPQCWQLSNSPGRGSSVRLLNARVPKARGVSLASSSDLRSQGSARTQIAPVPDLGFAGGGTGRPQGPDISAQPQKRVMSQLKNEIKITLPPLASRLSFLKVLLLVNALASQSALRCAAWPAAVGPGLPRASLSAPGRACDQGPGRPVARAVALMVEKQAPPLP